MPRKLDGKTDWYEVRRIATGLGVVGAGTNEPQLHAVIGEHHYDSEGGALDSSTSPVKGDLIIAASVSGAPNTCPYWQALGIGASGQTLWTAGCVPEWRTLAASDIGTVGTDYGVPGVTWSTTNTEGSTACAIRIDATVALFDVTTPCDVDLTGAVGSGSGAARWDHQHPLDQGIEPTWTGSHVFANTVYLDDGSGDSPHLSFVGETNDEIEIFLADAELAGDSDLAIKLADKAGDSALNVADSDGITVWNVNSDGDMDVGRYSALGNAASISTSDTVTIDGFVSAVSGTFRGIYAIQQCDSAAAYETVFIGAHGLARANTSPAQSSSGYYAGVSGEAYIVNGIAASLVEMDGGRFSVDVEDGTATSARGLVAYTPSIDTGDLADGYGINVQQGAVGTGPITTLYGLYIDSITAGCTDYAIYTNSGSSRFGDGVDISGILTLRQEAEPADPPEDAGVIWCSDGTGTGDPGDLMYKTQEGSVVKTKTLVDFSAI